MVNHQEIVNEITQELNEKSNVRLYGGKPYKAAVVHGGPGALGTVAAIARVLSKDLGVIEPLQTSEKCGHSPWKEKHAYQEFYEILRKELEE